MNQSLHQSMEDVPHIRVLDEWHDTIPEDLYIPPAAFEILLEQFEGPLDFLIYLIQKNGFDLIQLDIAPIATQYLAYMDSMKSLNIELTADYMVMAALLADLKSRLLLPKPTVVSIEKDPKQDLIDRLETYLRFKQKLESGDVLSFKELLNPQQGRMGMVVTFMAVLELTRQQKIKIIATGVEAPLAIQGSAA